MYCSEKKHMHIKAVIFDMDGLMLDTQPLYRTAWQQAAAEFGYTLSDATHCRLLGRNTADSEQVLMVEFGPGFPMDRFRGRCQALEAAFEGGPVPKKHGLDELLGLLDSRRVPRAVATSTQRKISAPLLARMGLFDRFDAIATGDEVQNGKPAPDLFLLAAERLGVEPAGCLVLEDSEPGVIAAHRAGMQVFNVPDLQVLSATTRQLANGVFDSLAEVARHLTSTSIGQPSDHVAQTIATYNLIAPDYKLTATPEMRAWEQQSMRRFAGYLKGKRVLVPGCGDGRDSRFLSSLGLRVTSFDLSERMLKIAMAEDPGGRYVLLDLREIYKSEGTYDGIYASGCLYHLTKPEFIACVKSCRALLSSEGVFYLNMKEGEGEKFEEKPGPRYPGGAEARERLQGKRFYAYYDREELLSAFEGFEIVHEQKLVPGDGGFEFWLRKKSPSSKSPSST